MVRFLVIYFLLHLAVQVNAEIALKCQNLFLDTDNFGDPVGIWSTLNSRAIEQLRSDPKNSRHFSVPEFKSTVEYMIRNLITRQLEIKGQTSSAEFKLIKILLKKSRAALKEDCPYDSVIELSHDFVIVMDQKFSENGTDEDYLESISRRIQRNELPVKVKSYINNPNLYLFPTHQTLTIEDFVKFRSVPIFFIGTTAQKLKADSVEQEPSSYQEHDFYHLRFQMDVPIAKNSNFFKTVNQRIRVLNSILEKRDKVISSDHKKAIDIVLFYLFHEQGISVEADEIRNALTAGLAYKIEILFPRLETGEVPLNWRKNIKTIYADVDWVMKWLEMAISRK